MIWKGLKNMARSEYTDRMIWTDVKQNNRLYTAEWIFISALIAIGVLMCANDMFGFGFGLGNITAGNVGGAAVETWNSIADAVGRSDYTILPKFEGGSGKCEPFLAIMTIAVGVCAFLMLKSGKAWPLLIFVIPQLALVPMFDLRISVMTMAIMVAGVLFAVIWTTTDSKGFLKNAAMVVMVIFATAAIMNAQFASSFVSGGGLVRDIRTAAAELAGDIYYGKNPLESGDLSQRTRNDGDSTALNITMESPHSTYLRGFVGETYTGTSWETLDDSSHYSSQDLMYWLGEGGFNTFGQSGQARELTAREDAKNSSNINISIEVKDADSRYAYIPYGIEGEIDDAEAYGGSFLGPQKFERLKEYSYKESANPAKDWTDTAAKLFVEASEKNDAEVNEYLVSESYYNEYIYENYRYLSPSDRELLNDAIGSEGDQSKGHIDYKKAIEGICKYLKENFIYTEKLGGNMKGSALEEFLDSKRGYDVQYATAATLMFRYYGIPARYVEGYLLTPDDASKMKSGQAYSLPSDRAHAWTEIYIDGIGFVPIEVCPEYKDVMEEADMNVGISNNSLLREFSEESSSGGSDNTQYGGDTAEHPEKNIIFIICAILLLLLVFALLLVAIRKVYCVAAERNKRKALFNKANPKTAVSAMYAFAEKKGYSISREIMELGNRAAYSRDDITEEERLKMLAMIKAAGEEKKKNDRHKRKETRKAEIRRIRRNQRAMESEK